jgi:hypothetical protein
VTRFCLACGRGPLKGGSFDWESANFCACCYQHLARGRGLRRYERQALKRESERQIQGGWRAQLQTERDKLERCVRVLRGLLLVVIALAVALAVGLLFVHLAAALVGDQRNGLHQAPAGERAGAGGVVGRPGSLRSPPTAPEASSAPLRAGGDALSAVGVSWSRVARLQAFDAPVIEADAFGVRIGGSGGLGLVRLGSGRRWFDCSGLGAELGGGAACFGRGGEALQADHAACELEVSITQGGKGVGAGWRNRCVVSKDAAAELARLCLQNGESIAELAELGCNHGPRPRLSSGAEQVFCVPPSFGIGAQRCELVGVIGGGCGREGSWNERGFKPLDFVQCDDQATCKDAAPAGGFAGGVSPFLQHRSEQGSSAGSAVAGELGSIGARELGGFAFVQQRQHGVGEQSQCAGRLAQVGCDQGGDASPHCDVFGGDGSGHKRAASRAPAAGATLPARSVESAYRSLNGSSAVS